MGLRVKAVARIASAPVLRLQFACIVELDFAS